MHNILLLGSKSYSRQMLLKEIQLPFTIIAQDADETACDWGLPLQQLIEAIALRKMDHVMLQTGFEGQVCFVLTADTMSQDVSGTIHAKPVDRDDAIKKIKAARAGNVLVTSFCLDRKVWRNGAWEVDERILKSVKAEYLFEIPDEWIDLYLEKSLALQASGAIAIEGFGAQFLKSVHGSYSTIVGLPLFELREALEKIGFFK